MAYGIRVKLYGDQTALIQNTIDGPYGTPAAFNSYIEAYRFMTAYYPIHYRNKLMKVEEL